MYTTSSPLTILVVEDNPADFFLIEQMLLSSKVKIQTIYSASSIAEARELIRKHSINLILLDLSLPDSFGIDTFLKIKPETLKIPVIILTGLNESEIALLILQEGAQDYLVKGEFKSDALVKSIEYSRERKNVEEKILASEEKYRQMFYRNPFPAWIYDLETLKMLEVNDAAINMYGYERKDFLKLTIKNIRPEENINAMMESLRREGVPEILKGKIWRHLKRNGEIMLVEVTFYKIDYLGKPAMQAQINNVTERFRLEKELGEQQQLKQRQITDAVMQAQEKERKGIGEELHDNINQILATSKLFLSSALHTNSFEYVSKSEGYISQAMEEIRKLSRALITPVFIKSGLEQSIGELIKNTMEAKKISITTEIALPDESTDDEGINLAIYRIIQEQMNNIIKYAEASEVSIRIHKNESTIYLSIADNGKGFDTSLERKGIGLTNINSRAEVYNGKVEIDSSPGNGCRLTVEFESPDVLVAKTA